MRKIGNSAGVILPKEIVAKMNLTNGDRLFLSESTGGSFRITPYDPNFEKQMQAAEGVIARYRNTLKELAK